MDEREEQDELFNEDYKKLIREMLVVDNSLSKEEAIRKCHDRYVRHAMGHRDVALAMLRHNMPLELQEMVVLEEFEQVKTDFISHHLTEKISDVLYRLPRKDGKGVVYYYLFEHQRTVDYWMALRDWLYKAQIIERHRKEFPKDPKIPLVYTTVLYNGEQEYTAATSILDLIDAEPPLAPMPLS